RSPLPISDGFRSAEEYVETLLEFVTTSDMLQILCGGVHLLDFFTTTPGIFETTFPPDWRDFVTRCDPMDLLRFLMDEDLDTISGIALANEAPASLVRYVKDIRRLSLNRSFQVRKQKLPVIPRHVAVGMKPKKQHEVTSFAGYCDTLAERYASVTGQEITHFIDFGSGQNYLGRTLASPPYNRHIIAVESEESNIRGAKALDVMSGLAEKEKVMRNKKIFVQVMDSKKTPDQMNPKQLRHAAKPAKFTEEEVQQADFRSLKDLEATYKAEPGKGFIRYVEGRLEHGDLGEILRKAQREAEKEEGLEADPRLMAVSIHSCGNLSHHGIRSMILNPSISAVAIVGCCYNLLTEKLGPPTYKLPYMRPSLQAVNARVVAESARRDPQGFPMSDRLSTYGGRGVRFNITARMMACQAPQNWTQMESEGFFARHFFRAVLQKIFLDKGVIKKLYHDADGNGPAGETKETPFNTSTNPVIIGSLRKACHTSLTAYVRGAINKLTSNTEYGQYAEIVRERMGDMTDAEIARYEAEYLPRKREISAMWSLMAFSAGVVESAIVTDRWLFLKEHPDVVQDAWVEAVFDYLESPRNLVVVGIKK
ncbi:MAG: SAM-dependent methyltransferase, partial [Thaumarchaeota archaeon]|nr:SAM-dependent methyltransferase [Nitrososphaerota archaeon]